MIVLQDGSETLELLLDAATATSALTYYAAWVDHKGSPVTDTQIGQSNNVSNNTTAVTLVDAPSQTPTATKRQIKYISVYNGDSVPQTVTVRVNDSGTLRVLSRLTLLQGERMEFMADDGFQVRMADGGLRTQATIPYTVTQLKNQIINGNFDIWQRGTSTGSAATGTRFCADRWLEASAGSTFVGSRQAFTVGQTDVPGNPIYYHRSVIASVANASNFALTTHRIEDVRTFAGQTCTLSFYAKADASRPMSVEFFQDFGSGGSTAVLGLGVTKFNLTTAWQKFTVTLTLPSIAGATLGTNHFIGMNFFYDAGSGFNSRSGSLGQQSGTFDIAQVQFELGSLATSFDKRIAGVEIELCQRYYEKSYGLETAPGSVTIAGQEVHQVTGMASGSYVVTHSPRFKTRKRAIPAITLYNPNTGTAGQTQDNINGVGKATSVFNPGEIGFFAQWDTAMSASTGFSMAFHWAAESEL